MTRRQHLVLRALAVAVIVALHLFPRADQRGRKSLQNASAAPHPAATSVASL